MPLLEMIVLLLSIQVGPRQAKGKFTVIHPSGRFEKFKAASQKEADEWMKHITSAAARVSPFEFVEIALTLIDINRADIFSGQGS